MSSKVVTTWRPDTCGCELNYSWDRESSEDERVHTAETFKPCEAHKHHTDQHQHFAAVLAENQHKNKVVNLLAEKHGVKPAEFRFRFDKDRALIVDHPSIDLTSSQEDVAKLNG